MEKTIIIAEAGVNHNGSIDNAKKLIKVASKAKADYVKFQHYKTDNLVVEHAEMANYQKKNMGKNISQFKILKKYELKYNDLKKLKKFAKKNKIKFISSVFDSDSLKELFKLKIYDIKIPSGEINNIPLLEKISKNAKKIFISSGMASLKEISEAIKILKKNRKIEKNLFLMHCHSDYPTNLRDVNLLAMQALKNFFKVKIGYSDHTAGSKVGIAAVSLGAQVIEKHFTLSKKLQGPDHKASLEPDELKKFIEDIRDTEILLGSSIKKVSTKELVNKKFVRKSIVAKKFIEKGQKFLETNIICKRPEGGLSPRNWKKVIGKKAKKDFKKNQNIIL